MKKVLFFILFFLVVAAVQAQSASSTNSSLDYQKHLNEEFADKEKSPLTENDFKKFKGLDFFDINEEFIIKATFVKTPYQMPFAMPTTTDRKPIYVKYGEVHFTYQEEEFVLNVYQNQRLVTEPKYKDYLFIPFTDYTNGESTYGGGRYLDFSIPNSTTVILDFNKAYNPYCAYNGTYSCPIPPKENDLPFKVEAGVKKYHEETKS